MGCRCDAECRPFQLIITHTPFFQPFFLLPLSDFTEQQKKLEKIVNPIMAKVYGSSGGAPGGAPGGGADDEDLHEEL